MSKASNYQLITVFLHSVLHLLICIYIHKLHFQTLNNIKLLTNPHSFSKLNQSAFVA